MRGKLLSSDSEKETMGFHVEQWLCATEGGRGVRVEWGCSQLEVEERKLDSRAENLERQMQCSSDEF